MQLGELLAAAELDMRWHELAASAPRQETDAFEAKALDTMGLDTADVPPRYRSSYFLHIWSNGYAAGYYAYLWTEMLDDDSYDWFVHHGGLITGRRPAFSRPDPVAWPHHGLWPDVPRLLWQGPRYRADAGPPRTCSSIGAARLGRGFFPPHGEAIGGGKCLSRVYP